MPSPASRKEWIYHDETEAARAGAHHVEDKGFDAVSAGTLAESWRQQPGAPCYGTDLTREQIASALAAAETARLPKRRDLAVAAIIERVGDGTTNPDVEYSIRLSRALFM